MKKQIRQIYKNERRSYSSEYRQQTSLRAAYHLAKDAHFQQGRYIACYHAVNNEFATEAIINLIWQKEKCCYLPRITHDKGTLSFFAYEKNQVLFINRYGILEPEADHSRTIDLSLLDVVIMPLVAFDEQGNRLGSGGGYYDRTFANKNNTKKPWLLGLAYSQQIHPNLPADPWDVKLDAILTEKNITLF